VFGANLADIATFFLLDGRSGGGVHDRTGSSRRVSLEAPTITTKKYAATWPLALS
jgi:hypothetical protein